MYRHVYDITRKNPGIKHLPVSATKLTDYLLYLHYILILLLYKLSNAVSFEKKRNQKKDKN